MDTKHFKVMAAAGLVLIGGVLVTVGGFSPAFLLILLVCPLMMMVMMARMGGGPRPQHEAHGEHAREQEEAVVRGVKRPG